MPHTGAPIPAAIRRAPALALLLLSGMAPEAGAASPAPPLVVLVLGADEGAPAPASLLETLQIQMAGVAIVTAGPGLAAAPTADRTRAAAALVAAAGAVLGVWVENESGAPPVALLHVVGARGPGVVEVSRFPGEAGPAMDRALALKVREILDTLAPGSAGAARDAAPAPARPAKGPSVGGGASRPASAPVERAPASAPALALAAVTPASPPESGPLGVALRARGIAPALEVFLVAAGAAGSLAAQVGGGAGFALRVTRSPWIGELHLEIGVGAPQAKESPSGRVDLYEVGLAAGGRGFVSAGRVGVGLALDAGARFVHARGTTPAGATGAAWRGLLFLRPGLLVRAGLSERVDLRAAFNLEVMPERLSFAVNDIPVADLGWLRASGVLSVAVSLQ